jgi:hypothetical protein
MTNTHASEESLGWHLDKKVPISIIVVVLVQAAAGLWAIADIKKDVEVLKAAQSTQHDRDERQDKFVAETSLRVQAALEKIDDKITRLLEKNSK